ncbi:cysteine proteinase [Thermothelomyces heterothallicus CBS 203.75]
MEETLEQIQERHRKEQRDLQSRITNKKKNATKKTRKFVNEECDRLERELKERQEEELRKFRGEADGPGDLLDGNDDDEQSQEHQTQPPSPPIVTADDLSNKLESTTLTSLQETPQSQSPPSQQQQKQQPRQKRNRQKERLARRAAEQEAAAAAAAAEAASMPDRRELERRAMQKEFAAHALREHEIAPDGHCLFSAVADQLQVNDIPLTAGTTTTTTATAAAAEVEADTNTNGGPDPEPEQRPSLPPLPPYRVVRRAAADWIAAHREAYEGFLEEGIEQYVARIRDTAEWGGELELSALANAYGVEIRVVQGHGRVEVVKPAEEEEEESGAGAGAGVAEKAGKGKTLWLAYYRHGYGLGEHYNSLRRVET